MKNSGPRICLGPALQPPQYWIKLNMKLRMINSLAVILVLSATTAMAQQKTMDDMKSMPTGKSATSQSMHTATGKVTKVDAAKAVVTLAHGPVTSLNWPATTMGFEVKDRMLLDKLTVGKTVDFEFSQAGKPTSSTA